MGPASGVKKDSLILNENSKYPCTSSAEKELDLIQLLHILFLQWKIILCITIAFTLAASLYTFLSPTVYQADALIQVEQKQNQAILNRLKNILPTDTSAVSAEIELLKSRMILGKTVDDLNLRIQSEQIYFPVTGYLWAKLKGESSAEITIQDLSLPQTNDQNSEVILTVQEKGLFHLQGTNFSLEGKVGERLKKENIIIEVSNIHAVPGSRFKLRKISKLEAISNLQLQIDVSQQGKESGMIALRITGHNPNEIARILDTVMNNYVQQNINRQAARDANSLAFLQRQLPKVQSELDDAESKLNVYRQQQDSVDLNLEAKTVLEQMVNVENQLNALTFREAEISQLYKKSHPAYRALLDKRQTLVQEKDKLNQRISAMPSTQQEVLKLSRDVETGREIYLQLLSRQQELNISRSSNVGNVRIIDPAVTWPSPVKPKKALIIMLGTMLGLISSSGLAIARVALRRGIESSETLENAGVHVLATVPVSKSLKKKYRHQQRSSIVNFFRRDTSPRFCLAFEEPADISIEAVRGLRTTLHFIMKETPNRVLMISGATMGCGKTFISSSLAAVIAQSGQRVLFIDADMRRGYTHILFNVENKNGLSDFLSGNTTLTESIQYCLKGQFDILTRGTLLSSPVDLLANERFKQLLKWANNEYDMVIVDSPPVLAVADAIIAGYEAGTCLVVTRANQDSLQQVNRCLRKFEQNGINVKGVILNGITREDANYYAYEYTTS